MQRYIFTSILSLTIGLNICTASKSHARPSSNDDEIIVVASRIDGVSVSDLTAPATIIDEDMLSVIGSSEISDILRNIAGVAANRSGPVGGLTQIRMRGSEGNHVLVLIDGVEAGNPNTGEFNFANLRAKDVVRIEILRGEQSALWGSDAIGGVINIITKSGNSDKAYNISLEAGSFNSLEGQLSAVIPVKKARLSVNGNIFRTDGIDVSGLGGEKDGAKSKTMNIGLNNINLGGVILSAKYSGAYSLSGFDSDTDFDGRLNNTGAELQSDTKLARITASFDFAGLRNKLNLASTDNKQQTTGTGFRNDTKGNRLQASWLVGKQWGANNIDFLAEIETEEFANFGGVGALQNQTHKITNKSIAFDYRFNTALDINLSARADFNDRFNNSQTWRIGAAYDLADFGGRFRASVGTGVKNPSMSELFGFFPNSFTPNSNLKPEKSLGYNIGYSQKIGGFNLGIDYFSSELQDEIYTIFNPNFTSSVSNRQTKSKRQGVEVEINGTIGALDIRTSASFLDAKENGIQEIRRPEFLASANINYKISERANLNINAQHNGSQYDMDFAIFSPVKLEAYTLLGANLQYKINDFLTFSLRGENLLDENYQEVVGYNSQSRAIYAGIKTDF